MLNTLDISPQTSSCCLLTASRKPRQNQECLKKEDSMFLKNSPLLPEPPMEKCQPQPAYSGVLLAERPRPLHVKDPPSPPTPLGYSQTRCEADDSFWIFEERENKNHIHLFSIPCRDAQPITEKPRKRKPRELVTGSLEQQ